MSIKKSKFGIGILLGSLAGLFAGLFLSEKPGKQLRDKTKKEYSYLKKVLSEKETDEAIKEIFGKVTKESKEIFSKTIDELAKSLTDFKQDLSLIDKNKYKKLVVDVTKKIKNEKQLPDDVLKKLAKYLEQDFSKIKSNNKKSPAKKKVKILAKK